MSYVYLYFFYYCCARICKFILNRHIDDDENDIELDNKDEKDNNNDDENECDLYKKDKWILLNGSKNKILLSSKNEKYFYSIKNTKLLKIYKTKEFVIINPLNMEPLKYLTGPFVNKKLDEFLNKIGPCSKPKTEETIDEWFKNKQYLNKNKPSISPKQKSVERNKINGIRMSIIKSIIDNKQVLWHQNNILAIKIDAVVFYLTIDSNGKNIENKLNWPKSQIKYYQIPINENIGEFFWNRVFDIGQEQWGSCEGISIILEYLIKSIMIDEKYIELLYNYYETNCKNEKLINGIKFKKHYELFNYIKIFANKLYNNLIERIWILNQERIYDTKKYEYRFNNIQITNSNENCSLDVSSLFSNNNTLPSLFSNNTLPPKIEARTKQTAKKSRGGKSPRKRCFVSMTKLGIQFEKKLRNIQKKYGKMQ